MAGFPRTPGDVVRIHLAHDLYAYGRMLAQGVTAYYGRFDADGKCPPDEVVRATVLFKVMTMSVAVTSGRWPVVGNLPLSGDLLQPAVFFRQDPLVAGSFFVSVGGVERTATQAECEGLERLAVWSALQIEDRLRDARAGRPNRWVEIVKIR
ncbi:MAG TPA: Imm26 family immunity protein [Myxococcales bacterium]|nr:Imm26 family immunity protein [Myxococcales bacterium]